MLPIVALFQVLALEGATVHSMAPGAEPGLATVLVEEGRFIAIGLDLEIPEDAIRVDLTGKHLFPGLIDGMVHHDLEHDPLYVLSGITLAQDMGNDLGRIFMAASPALRNRMPGPELHISGAIFDGVPPATTEAVIARNAAEVADKLPRLLEQGAQFASFHVGLPEEAWKQLIATGREQGVQVWGPIPRCSDLPKTLSSGQTGLSYLEGFQGADGTWEADHIQAMVQAYVESGIVCMPLLHVYGYRTVDQGEDPPVFNLLAPYYGDWWRSDLEQRRAQFTPEYLELGRKEQAQRRAIVQELWKQGVPMVPGSAAPNPWMAPGEGLHDELDEWVAAGIPIAAVLQGATIGSAQALNLAADRGSIEVGKVADAIVLGSDPRTDIKNLRYPEGVLMRGGFMDKGYLGELRESIVKAHLLAMETAKTGLVIEKPELPEGRVVLEGRVVNKSFERVTAAEEYWVVRTFEGTTAWVSRMQTQGSLVQEGTVQTLTQTFAEGALSSFAFEVESGELTYRVEGLRQAGKFRLKRWANGQYVDTNNITMRPVAVDAGMSTPSMILGHYRKDGICNVIYFEGTEPILGEYEIKHLEGGKLAVRTSEGPMVGQFFANGGLDKVSLSQGRSVVHYESTRCDSFGGPGMPMRPVEVTEEAAAETGKGEPEDAGGKQ